MEAKQVRLGSAEITLLRYKNVWVFPVISTYCHGLGSPVAVMLYSYENEELEPYCDVTVNLPDCPRRAGCQFVDTNNNGEDIIDWLEQYGLGKRTNEPGKSGFCTYPLFNFYKGDKYWEYRKIYEEFKSSGK